MKCQCKNTMTCIGYDRECSVYWCERCGTLIHPDFQDGTAMEPTIVRRFRLLLNDNADRAKQQRRDLLDIFGRGFVNARSE